MQEQWNLLLQYINPYTDIITIIFTIVLLFIIFSIILRIIKKLLLKKVKTKKQVTNVSTFIDLLRFLFYLFFIIIIVSLYYGSWGEAGFIAGLLTVALGWALQKPISGVVAWLILTIRRPLHIGDRVLISDVRGDISNITLTHILIDEIGGTIDGEEKSGRTVMIPNSIIFEDKIINYTEFDDYILDEVTTAITYESDLAEAEKIMIDAASEVMGPYVKDFSRRIEGEPHTRLKFKDSGIDVTVRYQSIAKNRNRISTDIRRIIYNKIRESADVEIAYPHAEVLFRNK